MNSPRILLAVLCLALMCGGCDTFERRSKEKAATFASLTPTEREKLKHGVVEVGDTPDMVYIALGAPDEKFERADAKGARKIWIYNSYHQEYAGTAQTGYHRILVYNPASKSYSVYFEPIYTDVYADRVEENIRIEFRQDKVAAIEQPRAP